MNEGAPNTKQTVMKKNNRKRSYKSYLTQSQKKEIKMMISKSLNANIEHKTFYTVLNYSIGSGTIPSTTGDVIDISKIVQGILSTNRIGQEVIPTSLEIRWNISTPNTVGQGTSYNTRMIAVISKYKSTNVSSGGIIHDASAIVSLISPYANSTRTVRKVLWDYQVSLQHKAVNVVSGSVATRASENSSVGSVYIPLNRLNPKWKPISFDEATTDGWNHIFLLSFSLFDSVTDKPLMWNHNIYTALNFIDA